MSTLLQEINVDNTFGACLIGAQISAMLYGLTTLQSYFYFVSYPDDSMQIKALVSIIWLLDSLHTALISMSMYHYLVTNYDNPAGLAIIHWSLDVSLGANILVEYIVQVFFATQIFRLANTRVRWWLTSVIGISVVAHLCFGIETLVLAVIKKEFTKLADAAYYAVIPFAASAVLSDVLIAGSLCALLYGSRTGYRKTNNILNTLIIYAINRCLLTSAVTVPGVIMYAAMRKSLWFLGIDFIIGKLYANSFLAHLNSRQAIRGTNTSPINSTLLPDIAAVQLTDLRSHRGPKTDNGAFVFDIHSGSISSSRGMQNHMSAKDKMSAVAPYSV